MWTWKKGATVMKKGKQIFLGNDPQSSADCYELHQKLEEAFTTLSAIQQSPFDDTRFDMDDVREIAADIYVALTGDRISYETLQKLKEEATDHFISKSCERTRDLLLLASVNVPLADVTSWGMEQREVANEWAAACHLQASDNDIEVPPKPSFLNFYKDVEMDDDGLWPRVDIEARNIARDKNENNG